MDSKILDDAAKAPTVFVAASLGEGEEYNRETGIQLTKEQIISLRKYETLGLSLPIRLQDVVAYLNYGAGDAGSSGLQAADFLRTFTNTYDHAKRWSPLREKIMLTGTDLKIFAGSIIRVGNGIAEIYEDLKASRYLEEHDINTPEEYKKLKLRIPNLPDLELPSGDIPEIKDYLNGMLEKIQYCHAKAEAVEKELDLFGKDMRQSVLPEIQLRLKLVSNNTYQSDIQDLQGKIDQRSRGIDELNKQYDQLVQEAIRSATTLNIGGLILGIYQGVKAQKIRAERNRLKSEQQVDNQKMASKNQTLSSLNKIRDDLQNLDYVAVEAEVATQNLMLVWNVLTTYIEASVNDIDKIQNATSLRRFKNQILTVIDPWEQIKVSSDQLLAVFAAADREYGNNNLVFRSKAAVASLLGQTSNPSFSMTELRNHNVTVQAANTTAQMLVEQYAYMPGTVGVMNDLALAINKTTAELRKNAQTSIIHLQRAQKKLRAYQAELAYPEDADEVREDMEVELKGVFNKVSAQTQDFKTIHASLRTPYDNSASEQWMIKLQQDRLHSEGLKTRGDEKLVELTEQMKSVNEGIDLIVKAGIEKIGEEAKLSMGSLKALGLAPPQVQVAMLAVDTLKKLISGIGEALSFLNMLAAYDRLKEKAADLRAQSQKHAKEIVQIDGKIELLITLNAMDEGRQAFVWEFVKLVADFESFTGEFDQDSSLSVEERTETALACIEDVIKFLKTLQQL